MFHCLSVTVSCELTSCVAFIYHLSDRPVMNLGIELPFNSCEKEKSSGFPFLDLETAFCKCTLKKAEGRVEKKIRKFDRTANLLGFISLRSTDLLLSISRRSLRVTQGAESCSEFRYVYIFVWKASKDIRFNSFFLFDLSGLRRFTVSSCLSVCLSVSPFL